MENLPSLPVSTRRLQSGLSKNLEEVVRSGGVICEETTVDYDFDMDKHEGMDDDEDNTG